MPCHTTVSKIAFGVSNLQGPILSLGFGHTCFRFAMAEGLKILQIGTVMISRTLPCKALYDRIPPVASHGLAVCMLGGWQSSTQIGRVRYAGGSALMVVKLSL